MGDQLVWYCLGGVAAAYVFLRALLRLTQDANEPPALGTSLPFIGPLIGLGVWKTDFFVSLRNKHHDLPIYTLRMPGQRTYVVNSLSLVPAVQRQIRAIAFHPIEHQAAVKVMGMTEAGGKILGSGWGEDDSYLGTFVKYIHPAVSPGPGLDEINRASVDLISASLDKRTTTEVVDLFKWVRHEMVMATSDAIYGPHNIFRKNPRHEQAWYKFEPGIMALMTMPWPSILARESFRARESLIPDLMEYFEKKRHLEGSLLVRCRYDHNTSHGLRLEDVARTEIGGMSASVTNTTAASFWLIWHVLSDPAVLAECRAEVERLVVRDPSTGVCTLDLADVKSSCPVLLSTWQETLRYRNIGIQARVVMEDHVLDRRYLLKKGATVMIVSPVLHGRTDVWGPTAASFDHRRFVPNRSGSGKRHKAVGFRGFGGGSTLCPGRHFVTTEVLSFVAMLLTRFDVRPVGGVWREPKTQIPMTAALPAPAEPIPVELTPRTDRKWRVLLTATGKAVDMITEEA